MIKLSRVVLAKAYVNSFYAVRDYDDTSTNDKVTATNKKAQLQKQTLKRYSTGAESQSFYLYIEGDTSSSSCVDIRILPVQQWEKMSFL